MSGFEKSGNGVENIQDLQSNKLKLLCWTGEDGAVCYAVQSDNRNKSPRYFLFPFEIASVLSSGLTEEVLERTWIDSGYGQEYGLSGLSLFEKALYIQSRAHKLLIEQNLLSYLESNRVKGKKLHEVRLTESIDAAHGFHNGMILFIDTIAQLYQLVLIYNNREQGHIQSSQFEDDDHEDRVDSLFVLPLSYLVTMTGLQLYQHIVFHILPTLQLYGENIHKKVELHHHITDIVLPGINGHWAVPSELEESKLNISHLANATHDVGLLFTINVKKKKIVIDVPGGKRNLAETSWECAMREAWEEIGVRLHNNVQIPDARKTASSAAPVECQQDWKMTNHYVSKTMSVFLLYGKEMLRQMS